jgi:hypothetical protein
LTSLAGTGDEVRLGVGDGGAAKDAAAIFAGLLAGACIDLGILIGPRGVGLVAFGAGAGCDGVGLPENAENKSSSLHAATGGPLEDDVAPSGTIGVI